MRLTQFFLLLAGLTNGPEVFAADDVALGKAVAQSTCAYCHMVSGDQAFQPPVLPRGPDFANIAARQNLTASKLRKFLMTTHRDVGKGTGMPNPLLNNRQINAVVSYVLNLRVTLNTYQAPAAPKAGVVREST